MVAIIHIGVGSDGVCSTGLGNARASGSGTDNRRFHVSFYVVYSGSSFWQGTITILIYISPHQM